MRSLDCLARTTCQDFLKTPHLKAICQHRGFPPPRGGKAALVSHVAPRLLEPTGAARAAASLEQRWAVVLHAIARAEEPLRLQDLAPVIRPDVDVWSLNYRELFGALAEGLLTRGLVLLDPNGFSSGQQRYRDVRLVLPEVHRPCLPPYPVPTLPLEGPAAPGTALAFLRQGLMAATRGKGSCDGVLQRLVKAITWDGDRLRVGGTPGLPLSRVLESVRGLWLGGQKAWEAADHVLRHLPEGRGVLPKDLRAALVRLKHTVPLEEVARFCEEGLQTGLLVGGGESICYRANPAEQALADDRSLVFAPCSQGIVVDVERTGLSPLFELAALCRVTPRQAGLRLEPDLVLLGRAAPEPAEISCLREVQKASPVFDQAVAHVRAHHGKLLLHEGLLVLRVEDPGLRTLLAHQLDGRVRSLGGSCLAIPRSALPEVEKLAKKQGLSPRRIVA